MTKAYCKLCGGNMYFGFNVIECDSCKGTEYSYDKVEVEQKHSSYKTFPAIASGSICSGQIVCHSNRIITSGMLINVHTTSGSWNGNAYFPGTTHTCNNCGTVFPVYHVACGAPFATCTNCGSCSTSYNHPIRS